MARWRAENPDRLAQYGQKSTTPEQKAQRREQYQARAAREALARRDRRPIELVMLEKSEEAFNARERHLQNRREWNARNVASRRQYRQEYADPTKADRATRYRQTRRTKGWTEKRTPEQQERKREYMRRWVSENRERVNALNAERQRSYRARRSNV